MDWQADRFIDKWTQHGRHVFLAQKIQDMQLYFYCLIWEVSFLSKADDAGLQSSPLLCLFRARNPIQLSSCTSENQHENSKSVCNLYVVGGLEHFFDLLGIMNDPNW